MTGTVGFRHSGDALRKRVGTTGVAAVVVVAALLPLVLDVGRSFLMSQICIYGVIALSLTVLTGWAGQVSLGQFALVGVGADMAAHLGGGVPLILLLPFAGVVTGLVSMLVGLTALRSPKSCSTPTLGKRIKSGGWNRWGADTLLFDPSIVARC